MCGKFHTCIKNSTGLVLCRCTIIMHTVLAPCTEEALTYCMLNG